MKKCIYLLLFTVCAMLHVTALSAQEVAKVKGRNIFIPTCLTKNAVPYMCAGEFAYEQKGNVKIYDANFEEITSFAFDYGYVVRKNVNEVRKEEFTNIRYVKDDYMGYNLGIMEGYINTFTNPKLDINDISCENIINMWSELCDSSYIRDFNTPNYYKLTSDTIFYPKNPSGYYYPEYFGEKYPVYIAQYKTYWTDIYDHKTGDYKRMKVGDIVIYEASLDFDIAYTGDWEIVSERYDTLENIQKGAELRNANDDFYNQRDLLSQNFFNDDENFETLVTTYIPNGTEVYGEYDRDGDGEIDSRTVRTKFDKKLAVYSNGSFSHYLNNMYEFLGDVPYYVFFGDNKYLCLLEKINGEYYDVYYRIDSSTNSIEQVGEPVRAKMSVRNEVVAIEFKEPVKEQCELIVSDATGKQYEKIFVEAGSANINYDTRALAAGIYNFTVVNKGKVVENGKIVVR